MYDGVLVLTSSGYLDSCLEAARAAHLQLISQMVMAIISLLRVGAVHLSPLTSRATNELRCTLA